MAKTDSILFLTSSDIKNLITMPEVIEQMRTAFVQISNGEAQVPLRTNIDIPEYHGGALFMPVYSAGEGLIGIKVVSLFKQNPDKNLPLIHAVILLLDGTNGKPLAYMDGEYITALRTGAASGLATDLLARNNATTVAIFGAGVQGRTQLNAIALVRPVSRVLIFDRSRHQGQKFADEMSRIFDFDINVAANQSELREADIICTATTSPVPVFSDQFIGEGTHINAIGAYRPDTREIPSETVRRSKLIVDSRHSCLSEAGDILIPIKEQLIDDNHIFAELGEIAMTIKNGRLDETEVTIFKSVGNAIQDIVVAGAVYRRAREKKIGTEIQTTGS